MGRDFSITGGLCQVESTFKPVSFCMYQMLKICKCAKDGKYRFSIKPKKLAGIILDCDNVLKNTTELPEKFLREFRFYGDETEVLIREHLEEAVEKFKEALLQSVAYGDKYLTVRYI